MRNSQCAIRNRGQGLLKRKEVFHRVRKQKSSLVTRLHLQGELAKSQILTEGSSKKECLRGERNEKCIYNDI